MRESVTYVSCDATRDVVSEAPGGCAARMNLDPVVHNVAMHGSYRHQHCSATHTKSCQGQKRGYVTVLEFDRQIEGSVASIERNGCMTL